MAMLNRRIILLVGLLAAPLLTGAEGGCGRVDYSSHNDPEDPNSPAQPFLDPFNDGFASWRLTATLPNHQMGVGNPLPSMEVGSPSTLATGGLTSRKFNITSGLVVEADVFWQSPTGSTTVVPEVWVGLSDEDEPTGTRGVAAGMWVDGSGALHFQVNGADIAQETAPSPGSWHRFTTTIRADRVVEFRVDGTLRLTGGSVDSWYLVRPIEACGFGYPERPRIDNVTARLP